MLPIILGAAGLVGLLVAAFSDDGKEEKQVIGKENRKKIFISFAAEDKKYRDYLKTQAKNERSPFDFIDMSVKTPWRKAEWQKKCRTKIKRCDGMIVLLSKNTYHAGGARWEIKCAKEEKIPVIGMHIKKDNKGSIPPELKGKKIIEWTWENLGIAIDKI